MSFDVVILDRVLHMLAADARIPTLETALGAVAPGGHLLVAERPKGMAPVLFELVSPGAFLGWSRAA